MPSTLLGRFDRFEPDRKIRLHYSRIGGAHLFRSPDLPGLCAADPDFEKAAQAVGYQIAALMTPPHPKRQINHTPEDDDE